MGNYVTMKLDLSNTKSSRPVSSAGPAPPARPDRIGSGARRTPSCLRREASFVLIRPVGRPIDGGGVSGLACCSVGPARSTREAAADVHCGIGSWSARCLSMGDYVTGLGAPRGVTARRWALMLPILSCPR